MAELRALIASKLPFQSAAPPAAKYLMLDRIAVYREAAGEVKRAANWDGIDDKSNQPELTLSALMSTVLCFHYHLRRQG